jgi:hypothetical protein
MNNIKKMDEFLKEEFQLAKSKQKDFGLEEPFRDLHGSGFDLKKAGYKIYDIGDDVKISSKVNVPDYHGKIIKKTNWRWSILNKVIPAFVIKFENGDEVTVKRSDILGYN